MDGPERTRQLALWAVVFLLVYVADVTLVTMATHDWYPLLVDTFCGSMGGLHRSTGPCGVSVVPGVLGAGGDPPAVALAGWILGGGFATAVAFRDDLRAK